MIFIISLKEVELKDKDWVQPLIEKANPEGSHVNFSNLFLWKNIFKYRIGQIDEYLIVKAKKGKEFGYFYPQGRGNLKSTLALLKKDAEQTGHPFSLAGISPENMEELEKLYPGKFCFTPMEASFDYVYSLEKMASLAGKKLHAKRNHINRFKANNDWQFELVDKDNFLEVKEMNSIWCQLYGIDKNGEINDECCAVTLALNYFDELGLEGGLIRSDGRVIAYTVGERQNSNSYVIHIEKAFGEIRGAYQIINQEYAKWVQGKYPDIVYINREEDMGYAGLRRAKRSYYPEKMVEKYWADYLN